MVFETIVTVMVVAAGELFYSIMNSAMLTGVSFGLTFFLLLIYSVFPLLFYLGIVFRTQPWTRVAGDSFLGAPSLSSGSALNGII